MALNARDFDISATHGFLGVRNLHELPKMFAAWDVLADTLPQLVADGSLRDAVDRLPLLATDGLVEEDEWRRAYATLATVSNAYVWCLGEDSAATVLPRQLAVPFVAAAEHFDLPPVVTHAAVVLWNWCLVDPARPFSLDNLSTLHGMHGGTDEKWFFLVTVAIEKRGAAAIAAVFAAYDALAAASEEGVAACLVTIAEVLGDVKAILLRMREQCAPERFYEDVRPFLAAWKGGTVLPDGLVYEGVDDVPRAYSGGSAAQSSLIAALDEALGLTFARDVEGSKGFLMEMRAYMPRLHRDFLVAVRERRHLIRDFAQQRPGSKVAVAYDTCVERMKEFRDAHIQIVAQYIVGPAARCRAKAKSLADKGTGGTKLIPFLKKTRDEAFLPLHGNSGCSDSLTQ